MTKYIIDQTHSDISFKVKHMMISSVSGCFNNYESTIISEKEDLSDAKLECVIDVASLYTSQPERDIHLKSDEFFDCENYPEIKFKSTSVDIVDDEYIVNGLLEIKKVAREVKLIGQYNGTVIDECGQEKYCFKMTCTVQRLRWFLDFVASSTRNFLIDNNVELILDLQFFKSEE